MLPYALFPFIILVLQRIFKDYAVVEAACTAGTHSNCSYWASRGECVLSPLYMMCNCISECNTSSECAADGVTKDKSCRCGWLVTRGLCEYGNITNKASGCLYSCALRKSVSCPVPPRYNNSIAVGGRRYMDRVTYVCAYGYRNTGNIGLRVCKEDGTWVVQIRSQGQPPICTEDASLSGPCNRVSFTIIDRTSVNGVGILDSRTAITIECAVWCESVPGCTYFAMNYGDCWLYYEIGSGNYKIEVGTVWKRETIT